MWVCTLPFFNSLIALESCCIVKLGLSAVGIRGLGVEGMCLLTFLESGFVALEYFTARKSFLPGPPDTIFFLRTWGSLYFGISAASNGITNFVCFHNP